MYIYLIIIIINVDSEAEGGSHGLSVQEPRGGRGWCGGVRKKGGC